MLGIQSIEPRNTRSALAETWGGRRKNSTSTPVGIGDTFETPNSSRMTATSCGETAMTRPAERHMRRSQLNIRRACNPKYILRMGSGAVDGWRRQITVSTLCWNNTALLRLSKLGAMARKSHTVLSKRTDLETVAIRCRMAGVQ